MYLVKKIYLSTIVPYLIVLMTIPAYCTAEERLIEVRRDPHSGQVVVYEANRPVLQYNYLTVQPPDGFVESVHPASVFQSGAGWAAKQSIQAFEDNP